MKKYLYSNEKACVIKFKNRRVVVQRQPENKEGSMFYIGLKKVDLKDSRPVIFSHNKSPNNSAFEITETGILISTTSAYALILALQEMILLSDIPEECLLLK